MDIRNIAIIAHVDHGKTTLVDKLLKSSHTFKEHQVVEERVMDSNALERERGITILAKNTAITYKDTKINILDTPGHADFSGEVERIMKMVDGVVLVVDAYEGTMPQTRFVLKKAFEAHLKPIVVINKVDKPSARPVEVIDEVLELFIDLGCDEDELDFPVCFASAVNNTCSLSSDISTQKEGMEPLLDMIIKEIPAPAMDKDAPLQLQPALLDYTDFVGRIGIGRIARGTIHSGEVVSCCRLDGSIKSFRVQKLYGFLGLDRIEIKEASAGEIVAISGLGDISVGETICTQGQEEPLEKIHISEPTVQMTFGTNTSPFCGKDGKSVTATKIEERLFREVQKDVSLRVKRLETLEEWLVSGRGELHLGILIETMRREGYEFQVSRPQVIMKEIDGVTCEPYEYCVIDVPNESAGSVIEMMGNRHGNMETMTNTETQTRLVYTIPSRGLIGFNTDFMTATKGYGIINHSFIDYRPVESIYIAERTTGVLVSMAQGQSTAYSIGALEDRGTMFIAPGEEIYEGMIVGEANKNLDLAVNVVKAKQQTNTRSSNKDMTVVLKTPRVLTLEACLEFINEDELVEITPKKIRLRKKILDTVERKKYDAKMRSLKEE
ncbi:MAG: translational GTPase TypA [Anaeroplasmataceae bacterium]|nr:translational GTPase TypA [Anaeroplasmataceae bacterium]MDE7384802.1 translational GTPase TypA [Anaeroplasmataceae bacterium]